MLRAVVSLFTSPSSPSSIPIAMAAPLEFVSPFVAARCVDAESSAASTSDTTAMVILNTPMASPPSPLFCNLWDLSTVRICADGGANRLFDSSGGVKIPTCIRGDLDSLRPDVRQHYLDQGVRVEMDSCQDTNDLDKALQVCHGNSGDDKAKKLEGADVTLIRADKVFVYGAFGGRFDQEMASMQALYKWGETFGYQVYLYSDETFAVLLPANRDCRIHLPFYGEEEHDHNNLSEQESHPVGEGPTCGLIPLGCTCESIVTDGLKWDLDGSIPLEFGGLVSTSNRVVEDIVTIRSSHPIIFTSEVWGGLKPKR